MKKLFNENFNPFFALRNLTKKYYNDVFVYGIKKENLIHTGSFKLPSNVSYAAIAQTPDKIMYAGGENETGAINTVYSIQKKHGASGFQVITWPSLPEAFTNAVAVATNAGISFLNSFSI